MADTPFLSFFYFCLSPFTVLLSPSHLSQECVEPVNQRFGITSGDAIDPDQFVVHKSKREIIAVLFAGDDFDLEILDLREKIALCSAAEQAAPRDRDRFLVAVDHAGDHRCADQRSEIDVHR